MRSIVILAALLAAPAAAAITLDFEGVPALHRPNNFYNGGSTLSGNGQSAPVSGPNLGITVRDAALVTRQIQATPTGFIGSTYVPTPPSGVNVLNFSGPINIATFNVAAGFTDEISVWWFGGDTGAIRVLRDEGGQSDPFNPILAGVTTVINTTQGCVFDFSAVTVTGCGWTKYTLSFTGTARSVVLAGGGVFDDLTFGAPGNVSGPVPEPASWALLIAGFGLTGAALRRRRAIPAVLA